MYTYPIDQDMVNAAPLLTFGQIRDLAKAKGINLKEHFKGIIPADVLDRVAMPKFARNVMPYWPVISWFQASTTYPCRCGCMTRLPEKGQFATPTCRVRYTIERERKPTVKRRSHKTA